MFPAMFGKPQTATIFDVQDFEKLYRGEDSFPFRRGIETLGHFRKYIRPDIYEEFGSLVSE